MPSFTTHISVWFCVKSSALTDVVTMSELMCSWQENNGTNSIEIFAAKRIGGGTNIKKKPPPKLKFGQTTLTSSFRC